MVKPSMNSPKYLPNVIIRRFMLQIYKRFQHIVTSLTKYLYTFYLFRILSFRLELRRLSLGNEIALSLLAFWCTGVIWRDSCAREYATEDLWGTLMCTGVCRNDPCAPIARPLWDSRNQSKITQRHQMNRTVRVECLQSERFFD